MKQNKVELVTDGVRTLVFVDGVQLRHVLEFNIPVNAGEITPQIKVTLHPEQINIRHVDSAEFKSLKDGALAEVHKGERIIPSVENAALMGWSLKDLAEAVVAPLETGLDGATLKPSKRELLEQILAEQRKTTELLGTWVTKGL